MLLSLQKSHSLEHEQHQHVLLSHLCTCLCTSAGGCPVCWLQGLKHVAKSTGEIFSTPGLLNPESLTCKYQTREKGIEQSPFGLSCVHLKPFSHVSSSFFFLVLVELVLTPLRSGAISPCEVSKSPI